MSGDLYGRSELRQLLILQFMLHEVQHHQLMSENSLSHPSLTPIAYTLVDIYKCLHQGEFGVGHTIDQPEPFKKRLLQEIQQEAAATPIGEPALEAVSADGMMLRVNLRPLKHFYDNNLSLAADDLAQVCVDSARISQGSGSRFFKILNQFERINQAGEIALAKHIFAFPHATVEAFFAEVRQFMDKIGQIPVLSHSDIYRRLNRPSYRVVERSVLQSSPLAALLEDQR